MTNYYKPTNLIHIHDIWFGQLNEDYIETEIEDHFNTKLKKLNSLHSFDFYSKQLKCFFEIKSRNCNHNSYDNTIITNQKFQNGIKLYEKGYNIYYVFVFKDCNYYYRYRPTDNFETKVMGRSDRNVNEYKPHINIPIHKLTQFI